MTGWVSSACCPTVFGHFDLFFHRENEEYDIAIEQTTSKPYRAMRSLVCSPLRDCDGNCFTIIIDGLCFVSDTKLCVSRRLVVDELQHLFDEQLFCFRDVAKLQSLFFNGVMLFVGEKDFHVSMLLVFPRSYDAPKTNPWHLLSC